MPTYDYRCKDCGHEFEIHQSFSEDALTVCPVCQGNLRKVFSAVGISFKGSGFYKTDSRGSSSATTPPASSDSSKSDSSKSDSGSSSSGSDSSSTAASTPAKSSETSSSSTTASTTSP
ncbi:MAG: FmdB family zinc ribbon protein [Acidimicrobiales bacterium]